MKIKKNVSFNDSLLIDSLWWMNHACHSVAFASHFAGKITSFFCQRIRKGIYYVTFTNPYEGIKMFPSRYRNLTFRFLARYHNFPVAKSRFPGFLFQIFLLKKVPIFRPLSCFRLERFPGIQFISPKKYRGVPDTADTHVFHTRPSFWN